MRNCARQVPRLLRKIPISLDAILVCRKKAFALRQSPAVQDVRQAVDALSSRLQAAGLRISAGDRFVIGAAQTLIARAADDLSFDEIKVDLDVIRLAVGPNAGKTDDEPETTCAKPTRAHGQVKGTVMEQQMI